MSAPPVLVARQPIYDRSRQVVAYELLFRTHDADRAMVVDDERATAHVLVTSFVDIGPETLVGGRLACVNVSRQFLLDVTPLPFGPEGIVLELLENQPIDDALIDRCAELVHQGYLLALDDFTFTPEAARLLALASIVKLDVRALGPEGVERELAALEGFQGRLLAEKVEDEPAFERCVELGFDLFQGWFFCKPTVVEGRAICSASLESMQVAATVADEELPFEELQRIVMRDPGLTVRLLRLLNSAAFPTVRRIVTVNEGLVMLGERKVRQWTLLVLLAGLPAASDEILTTALVRARLLERLAAARGDATPDGGFVVGLFSIADGLLGMPMETVLAEMPLADEHVAALLRHEGPNGRALAAVIAHERGDAWSPERAGVTPERFGEAYVEALSWAQARPAGLTSR